MKKIATIVLVGVAILGFYFYWYGWRPSEIRKNCSAIACMGVYSTLLTCQGEQGSLFSLPEKEKLYNNCLKTNGLEK